MLFQPQVLAAAGALFLDTAVPGWPAQIDLDSLDLEYENYCMLGQLFTGFSRGTSKLDLDEQQVVMFGFFVNHPLANVMKSRYARLTAAWKSEIKQRLPANTCVRPTLVAA